MRRAASVGRLALWVWLAGLPAVAAGSGDFPRGEVVADVACLTDPFQHYALYLPSSYAPGKLWPVLIAFDPAARGRIPVERFKEAAEALGMVVVGSNNSRNGPWADNARSAAALWEECRSRFAADERRVYVAGFSGGARLAAAFTTLVHKPVAGVVSCGAGLPEWIKPEALARTAVFLTAGVRDFNRLEIFDLESSLRSLSAACRFRSFDGEHDWAPADVCREALEWMDLRAMRDGLRPLDRAVLETASAKRLERARKLESQGLTIEAERAYREVKEDFPDSDAAGPAEESAERLRGSDSYVRALRSEAKLRERERARLKFFWELIRELARPREDPSEAFYLQSQFGVNKLLQDARRAEDAGERDLAYRLLAWLESNAGDLGMGLHARRNFGPAIELMKLAGRASGDSPRWLYNLACAYSQAGAKRDALRALESAVKNGFVDVELMLRDADLEPIRNEPAFKSLLQRMK